MLGPLTPRGRGAAVVVAASLLLTACQAGEPAPGPGDSLVDEGGGAEGAPLSGDPGAEPPVEDDSGPTGPITLAFGGDVHFEGTLAQTPYRRGSTLGPMSRVLRNADVAMVNLESALTDRDRPAAKELEDSSNRYWFRSPPEALDVLDRSGVDVVTIANNHGADHGPRGLRDALRAGRQGPVAVVGAGRTQAEAFTPWRTTVRGTEVAVLAADASKRESADDVWAVGPDSGIGLATARLPHVNPLVDAVRTAAGSSDVVVVYLHWGQEYATCPDPRQQRLAAQLAEAGADVVVGTHAHELQGAGMLDDSYVSYGLGGLYWYHGFRPESGVLRLTVRDGEVVRDQWVPGLIPLDGGALEPETGAERVAGVRRWQALRGCTNLRPGPSQTAAQQADPAPVDELPPYAATTERITPALAAAMTGTSHDPATCPVPLSDLRHLTLSYVDFRGRPRRGEMVVNADVAADVVAVFRRLYAARFPIQRMRLVDAYGGDDDASMAANNTSAYNCRTVAGSTSFSNHAYGRAVDINPVQNPYVLGGDVLPPGSDRFARQRRGDGVITGDGLVRRVFARVGWRWGGDFSEPDYQHFDTT